MVIGGDSQRSFNLSIRPNRNELPVHRGAGRLHARLVIQAGLQSPPILPPCPPAWRNKLVLRFSLHQRRPQRQLRQCDCSVLPALKPLYNKSRATRRTECNSQTEWPSVVATRKHPEWHLLPEPTQVNPQPYSIVGAMEPCGTQAPKLVPNDSSPSRHQGLGAFQMTEEQWSADDHNSRVDHNTESVDY